MPAFMQQYAGTGKENIGADDTITPRVALMQAVNEEVQAGLVDAGHFWHSIAEQDFGTELEVVPVHYSKRYTLWNPRHAGGGVLARASDGVHWDQPGVFQFAPSKDRPKKMVTYDTGKIVGRDVGLGMWGTSDPEEPDSPPAATLSHVFVMVAPEFLDLGPFVIFLQRSAEPVAKLLLTKITTDQAPIFGQKYKVGSKLASGASGDYNQYVFTKNGHVDNDALFQRLMKFNTWFQAQGVKVREQDEDAELKTAEKVAGDDDKAGSDKY